MDLNSEVPRSFTTHAFCATLCHLINSNKMSKYWNLQGLNDLKRGEISYFSREWSILDRLTRVITKFKSLKAVQEDFCSTYVDVCDRK